MSKGRAEVLVLFIDEVLQSCRKWLNEFVRLRGIDGMDVSMSDMYKYLAVLLYSHCTGFSMKKVVSLLGTDGGWSISKVLVNFIHGNILAYSPTGRGSDSSFTWNPQRDQTIHLSEFERKSFRMSAKVYLNPNHIFCTLDDDLMGTRADDNPHKTVSARKADREGHSMTAVADAFFRVFLHARLARRGETKKVAVRKLLCELLDNRGEKCLEGIVLTLDRGYASEEMVATLLESSIACVSILKNVSVRGHPFVGRSYLTVGRNEESDEDLDIVSETQNEALIRPDRPVDFIIDDSPNIGLGCARAVKSFGRGKGTQKVTALAIRTHGNDKYSNILRFMHAVPTPVHDCLKHWVTTHYTWDLGAYLFNYKNGNGRVTIPTNDATEENTTKQDVEFHVLRSSKVLTVAQRCADWFTMREFRVTSTAGANLLLKCPEYREWMGLSPPNSLYESPSEILEMLAKGWFTTNRSTEAMLRGTVNEDAVLNSFSKYSFIDSVYKIGMVCDRDKPWLAASLDGIAVFDFNACRPDYTPGKYEKDLHVLPIEIKTAVGRDAVARGTNLATPDLIICDLETELLRQHVPKEHIAQIVHQCIACHMTAAFYVYASESQILYILLIKCDQPLLDIVENYYHVKVSPALSWAHAEPIGARLLTDNQEMDRLISARLPFWKMVSNDIYARGPFVPVRIFKHGSQTLYNKTKGGVDGNAQMRAILRCSTDTLKWEQKVVTQVLKSITVNAWVGWRQLQREDLLSSGESFKGLEQYRSALNRVESLADFICELTPELLAYAETLDKDDDPIESRLRPERQRKLRKNELRRLISKAKGIKRYRLVFFNSADGVKLRLNEQRHDHYSIQEDKYCALCGNNTRTSFRGHRTRNVCKQCDVHLCVKICKPFKPSCWDLWHSVRKLRSRQPQSLNESESSDEGEQGTNSSVDEQPRTRSKTKFNKAPQR